jgi:hypothetical protein
VLGGKISRELVQERRMEPMHCATHWGAEVEPRSPSARHLV